jgi:hypothetical protein
VTVAKRLRLPPFRTDAYRNIRSHGSNHLESPPSFTHRR